jgi:hypothetical protein
MAIYEKGGLFYVDGSNQSFPRIEEARVVNNQLKQGTEFGQGQKGVAEVAGSPEAKAAIADETSKTLKNVMPSVAATGAGMLIPGVGEAGVAMRLAQGASGGLARAGFQGIAEYARQLISGEPVDTTKAATSAGLSAATEGALAIPGAAIKGAIKMAPGIQERLAQSEIPAIKAIGQKFGVSPDQAKVSSAYDAFTKAGQGMAQGVPLDTANQPLRDLFESMRFRKGGEQQKELLADLARTTQAPIRSFEDVDSLLHKVNRTLEGATSAEEKMLIYKAKEAIWKDIDNAQVPAAQKAAYRTAVDAAKKDFAYKELDTLINDSVVGHVGQQTGAPVPATKSLLEKYKLLSDDPAWVKTMGGEAKVKAIDDFITKVHQKVATGSKVGTATVLAGVGGAIGASMGGPLGAAAGAAGGVMLPAGISKLANNPKAANLFLKLIDPNTKPIPRQVFTGIVNALVSSQSE